MRRTNWLVCGGFLLAAFVVPALADVVDPTDPNIFIDSGDPAPIPITVGINEITPNNTFTDRIDFINDTNAIVAGFLFETTVSKNFTGPLTCGSGYFLHCKVTYTASTGDLIYDFFGVNPPDHDEIASIDSERGEHEGIPLDGLFHITLTGFDTGTGLYNSPGDIKTFNASYTLTPEPSTIGFLGAGLLALGIAVRYRRRKSAAAASR